jgi:hypothetical protein
MTIEESKKSETIVEGDKDDAITLACLGTFDKSRRCELFVILTPCFALESLMFIALQI